MRRNDIRQLHETEPAELQQKLGELQRELARIRLERVAGKAPLSRVRTLSDDIARVKTVLHEKQLRNAAAAVAELEAEAK